MQQEVDTKKLITDTWQNLQIETVLGGGAFGVVYACTKTDAVTGVAQREAVKVIRVDFTPEDHANAEEEGVSFAEYYRAIKEKRLQEIKWMVELKSPHIVHINGYCAVEEPDLSALYILIRMDYLTSLDKLRSAHLQDDAAEAAALAEKVCLDICDALRVCHSRGVYHRDIKPANILCSANGDFYLGDFGISKDAAAQLSTMTSSGTLEYAPREVMTGQYDHRADLYSLGLVLYALVNHWRAPFLPAYPAPITPDDRNKAQYTRLHGTALPAPDNCTETMAAVIAKLCAFAPEGRFSSAEDVIAAIHNPALLAQGTASPKPKRKRRRAKPLSRKARRRLVAGVLGTAAVVGAGFSFYFITHRGARDISLGVGQSSTDVALSMADDLLHNSGNFMLTHGLTLCQDTTVTIPGGALVYLIDTQNPKAKYPGYTEADDVAVDAGDLTLTFTNVTAQENDDGTVTYTITLAESADITQRRTMDAPVYGVGARFKMVLPCDINTGYVYSYIMEDWIPERSYDMTITTTVDGRAYDIPINRSMTWDLQSIAGEAAAMKTVDDLEGFGVPGKVLRATYVKNQTITLKAPANLQSLGLLVNTDPYTGYTETDYETPTETALLEDTDDFTDYDHYLYYSLADLVAHFSAATPESAQ